MAGAKNALKEKILQFKRVNELGADITWKDGHKSWYFRDPYNDGSLAAISG